MNNNCTQKNKKLVKKVFKIFCKSISDLVKQKTARFSASAFSLFQYITSHVASRRLHTVTCERKRVKTVFSLIIKIDLPSQTPSTRSGNHTLRITVLHAVFLFSCHVFFFSLCHFWFLFQQQCITQVVGKISVIFQISLKLNF